MKQRIRLGVMCFIRTTFDHKSAGKLFQQILEDLNKIEQVEIVAISKPIIEPSEAGNAARILAGKDIDGVVVISGTFHLGHLVLEISKILDKPLLLWGLPELPYNGGKIRLNSICGVALDASNLYKSGIRNYITHFGDKINETWIDAIRIQSAISRAHVGILGYRAKGFFNIGVCDLNAYEQMGILIDHFELHEVWNYPVTEDAVKTRIEQVKQIFDINELTEEQIYKVAALSEKLSSLMTENKLTALAIRCWPEFASEFGISPCAAMSILQGQGMILACEGDVDGAVSMIAQRALGGDSPYLFDFSQINMEEDYALLWHCGVAPYNLWDGKCKRSLSTYFAGGKGVTADFVLKDGDVSIVRFDSVGTEYRLFLASGEVFPMEKELRGTYMKARFNKPVTDIFQAVIDNGIAHHASVVYGKFTEPFRVFAKIKGWQIIE